MNGSFMGSDQGIMLTEAKSVPDIFFSLTFSCSYLKNIYVFYFMISF